MIPNALLNAEPLRLVRPNQDRTSLIPVEATLEALMEFGSDHPEMKIRVCSLSGTQRAGKSTLLNCFFRKCQNSTNQFKASHLMDPETQGLWIRAQRHPFDSNILLLFVDSEGLDSPHVPQYYNWSISALMLLISDLFMYQSRGCIDARTVDRLEVILNVAEQLSIDRDHRDLPSFLWVLRDHHLKLVRQSLRGDMVEKLSKGAHQSLVRCFKEDYDCITLPNPTPKTASLDKLDKLQFEEYGRKFQQEFLILEAKVYSILGRDSHYHQRSGADIASLIRLYCEAIECRAGALGDIDDIPTQGQLMQTLCCERAIRSGLVAYDEELSSSRVVESVQQLRELHEAGVAAARMTFNRTILGESEDEENSVHLEFLLAELAEWETKFTINQQDCLAYENCLVGGRLLKYYEQFLEQTESKMKDSSLSELQRMDHPLRKHKAQMREFELKEKTSQKEVIHELQRNNSALASENASLTESLRSLRHEIESANKEYQGLVANKIDETRRDFHDNLDVISLQMRAEKEETNDRFQQGIHLFNEKHRESVEICQQMITSTEARLSKQIHEELDRNTEKEDILQFVSSDMKCLRESVVKMHNQLETQLSEVTSEFRDLKTEENLTQLWNAVSLLSSKITELSS